MTTRMIVEKKLLKKNLHNLKLDETNGEAPMKPNTVDKTFSDRMQKERLILGWTRKDLARNAGLTESVIALYETGKAVKNDQEMNKIQRCLNQHLKNKKN